VRHRRDVRLCVDLTISRYALRRRASQTGCVADGGRVTPQRAESVACFSCVGRASRVRDDELLAELLRPASTVSAVHRDCYSFISDAVRGRAAREHVDVLALGIAVVLEPMTRPTSRRPARVVISTV